MREDRDECMWMNPFTGKAAARTVLRATMVLVHVKATAEDWFMSVVHHVVHVERRGVGHLPCFI